MRKRRSGRVFAILLIMAAMVVSLLAVAAPGSPTELHEEEELGPDTGTPVQQETESEAPYEAAVPSEPAPRATGGPDSLASNCTLTDGISNGSFETGDFTGWCIKDMVDPFSPLMVVADGFSPGFGLFSTVATDGTMSVSHGFDGGGPDTIELAQQVTIPGHAGRADLSFDWRAGWDLFAVPTMDRSADVVIEPAGGEAPLATTNIVMTDFATTTTNLDTGPMSSTIDLLPYAASSVVVNFMATVPESFTGPAHFQLDNVVLDVNVKPQVAAPIPDVVVNEDAPDTVIDLDPVFSEDDGEALTFSVTNSNPDLLTATVDSPLTLAYNPGRVGTATVTVEATDPNGFSASDSFEVTVNAILSDVGLVDPIQGRWHLRNSAGAVTSFFYGNPGDLPISGDWDGDGISTPGLYRQSDGFFYARNSNDQGIADTECFAGNPEDVPLNGDWDGDGDDNLGIYRPSEQMFYLFTTTCTGSPMGAAQISFLFGNPGDKPVAGDWDGDGIDEVGLHRESTGLFYWRNTLDTGIADGTIFFGNPGDRFVAGDWGIVDGVDTPAVFRPSNTTFFFRHTLTQGIADSQFVFGEPGWLPVAGEFGLG